MNWKSLTKRILGTMAAIAVVYVLSFGPVCASLQWYDQKPKRGVVEIAYRPLMWVMTAPSMAGDAMAWYVSFWMKVLNKQVFPNPADIGSSLPVRAYNKALPYVLGSIFFLSLER